MAKGGAFNVTALIKELGLQTISGDTMRVLETIQPTIPVGDLSDVTPPHVQASGFFGEQMTGGGGLFGTCEIQCLGAGGLFIDWVSCTGSQSCAIRIQDATIAGGLPVVTPAGRTSRDPLVSIVRLGQTGNGSGSRLVLSVNVILNGWVPLFVPRGKFFLMQTLVADVGTFMNFSIREVPASEHSPT